MKVRQSMSKEEKSRRTGKKYKKPAKNNNDILERRNKELRNRETNIISFVFAGLFMLMIGYLVYFNYKLAPDIINSPYNKRVEEQEAKVTRGDILAYDGTVLATTQTDEDGNQTRYYPYDNIFCHVIGLSSAKTGVEGAQNYNLMNAPKNILSQISSDTDGEKAQGNTVITSLMPQLQEAAYDALGANRGAVIAMEPSTGRILAMVSKPDYDPNAAPTDYSEWLTYSSKNSVLLNRATQGLYAPGSTFKIMTALEYLRENNNDSNFSFDCSGSAYIEGGTTIPCFDNTAHGYETLKTAFANSCNSAFSTIGAELNKAKFRELCTTFLFNSALPIDLEYSKSSFNLDADSGISEAQETGIGQGKTMMSPLHNLLIAATVANDGIMMKPTVVDRVQDANGTVVQETEQEEAVRAITADEADTVTDYMRAVVTQGTGYAFKNSWYNAAGKTGSAQYDSSSNVHSWFTGFAPYDNPQIAICVVLEGGYTGVPSAQYVAKSVLDTYFSIQE